MKKYICENCGNEHDGSYGTGRFCSLSCKQNFVASKPGKTYSCKYCGKIFESPRKLGSHVRFCKKNPKFQSNVTACTTAKKNNKDKRDPFIIITFSCYNNCGRTVTRKVRKSQYEKNQYSHFCSSSCAHAYAAKCADPVKISTALSTKMHVINCCKCGKQITVKACVSKAKCEECKNPHKHCLICGKPTKNNNLTCCKEHALELRIKNFKATCKVRHSVGGLRSGGKSGCKGWYKGIHCDSSWELAWVIYNIDHNIVFTRNTKVKFPYTFKNKKYNYFPDFKLADGSYVEIKGYDSPVWQAKLAAVPANVTLHVIYAEEIQKYIDYAVKKFGKDFTCAYKNNF